MTHVVYKIDCKDCNLSYIRTDETTLGYSVERHNDINKHVNSYSVVSQHRLINNHDFKWSTSRILHVEKSYSEKGNRGNVFYQET